MRLRTIKALLVLGAFTAVWGQTDKDRALIGERGRFWIFQTPVRPSVPSPGGSWGRNPIDAFILQALEEKHLIPSKPVDRAGLIRRVTFDLTGLPPTPKDVEAFLKDRSPQAYDKVVDRLLASPQYGERWASKWLDVVRYADTNGFELDQDRPQIGRAHV